MKKICTLIALFASTYLLAQPANDEPCGAITIPVVMGACVPTTNYNYTGATSSTTLPSPACSWASNKKDVWFKFVVPATGTVTIVTDGGATNVDFTLALYSASSCTGTFGYVGCDDDSGPANLPMLTAAGLLAGTYYIRFWAFTSTVADGQVKICVSFAEPMGNTKVGIGTSLPTNTLDVNGEITIRGGGPAAGKVLTSDNNGKATWESSKIGNGFLASADYVVFNSNVATKIPFATFLVAKAYDDFGSFNNTTNSFLATEAGAYHYDIKIRLLTVPIANTNGSLTLKIYLNGIEASPISDQHYVFIDFLAGQKIPTFITLSGTIVLAANDQISVYVRQNSGLSADINNSLASSFAMFKIK